MEILILACLGFIVGIGVNRLADYLVAHDPELSNTQARGRAPLVNLTTAVLFAILWLRFGATVQLGLTAIDTAVFMLVLITDLEHRAIFPDVLIAAIGFAAIASPFSTMRWQLALLGGATAFVIVFGIYAFSGVYARARGLAIKGGAFGRGDVFLATFVGVVTGFPAIIYALVYTILLGGIGALASVLYQRYRTKKFSLQAVIPYGPFFCIAGWAIMVFGLA